MSSRKPKNEGAIVAYDEENAPKPKPKPKKKKPRPPAGDGAPPPQNSRNQGSKNRQVPDDNVSDVSEADVEHDPNDEPRFKYSTAELAESGCRTSTCCIITMVIICVVVAIALSIVMVRVFQEKDEENQAPPPTFAPTTLADKGKPGISMFRSPQSVIADERCKQGNANSIQCQNACEGFECCDPTLAQEESCFYYNQEGCLNYKRCHVISSGVGVPSDLLEQVCSPERIAADRSDCDRVCANVACCYQDESPCYDKFYTCLDYAPCLNLRSTATVPVAGVEVREFCDTTKAGSLTQKTACEDACKPAECCWSEDPDSSCLKSDFLSCMTYTPCGQIDLPGAGNQTALPPTSIRSDCSVTKINTGDTAACETTCEGGACCEESGASSCFLDDPLACVAYQPCSVLV